MRRLRVHGGVLVAAVAVAIFAAACLPPAPPPAPAPAPPTVSAPPSPGQLTISPASIDYGSHPLSDLMSNMPNVALTVTNTGGQPLHLVSEFSSNGIYSMPVNSCSGASLAPGQSCGINLQYCPSATGTTTTTVTVLGITGTLPISATANATGTAT